LKKGLEETYSTFLPKQTHPFVYLSIEIVPQNIDVNIHPTKNEVRMLNETEIIEVIQKEVDSKLLSCNSSRTFYVQTPGDAGSVNVTTAPPPAGSSSSTPAKSLVRTESRVQPLTMYFDRNEDQNDQPAGAVVLDELETDPINPVNSVVDSSSPSTKKSSTNLSKRARVVSEVEDITTQIDDTQTKKQARTKQTPILLTSIRNLIEKVESQAHQGLTELFHNYTFVGCANSNFALVQFRTKLYLMRVDELRFVEDLKNTLLWKKLTIF
jgi:DNA mismatch repair protein MLH1